MCRGSRGEAPGTAPIAASAPAGGTGCRRKSSFLQRGGPFADIGRVLPGGDRPAPWNGEPPGRHGRRGVFAGGISDCAQSGLSIQGIWSLGSALETGLFAIDGPRTERPGDEADRRRAISTRTLGRFSAQGTPEGKVWSEAEELLSSARSLAGSKRRQERRFGGALRGFPRTCVPDASLFGRPRRQLQQYSAIAAKFCIRRREYLRAVEKTPDKPTAPPATIPAGRARRHPAADSMSRMASAMATRRSALRT